MGLINVLIQIAPDHSSAKVLDLNLKFHLTNTVTVPVIAYYFANL